MRTDERSDMQLCNAFEQATDDALAAFSMDNTWAARNRLREAQEICDEVDRRERMAAAVSGGD